MRTLKLAKGRYGKVVIEKRDGEELICRVSYTFDAGKHFRKAAKELDVGRERLVGIVDRFQKDAVQDTVQLEEAVEAPFWLTVRGIYDSGAGEVFKTMQEALRVDHAGRELVITWDGMNRLAAVDFDIDPTNPPLASVLRRVADTIHPRPRFAWSTRSGGLRLMYEAVEPYSAGELAAIAALGVTSNLSGMVELKSETRFPPGVVWTYPAGSIMLPFAAWLGERTVEEEEVAAWLAERGLVLNQSYPHDRCPMDPANPAKRDPVFVGNNGLFCHACAGRGIARGANRPGFFPYAILIGRYLPNRIAACVENRTHWEHAQHVLAFTFGMPDDIAKRCYAAALKWCHGGEDPRIARVFTAGENMMRFEKRWVTRLAENYRPNCEHLLAALPACQYVEDGEMKVNKQQVTRFIQPIDLSDCGYATLTPIWGLPIHGRFLVYPDSNRIPVVLQTRELVDDAMAGFRPRYIDPAHWPMGEEAAWEVLEDYLPGLNRRVVKLLIAAKGSAEGDVSLPPMIFISGPTGAGKTTSVQLAATIAGDKKQSITWSGNKERARQGVSDAKEIGSYITFDEALKEGERVKETALQTMDFVLTLTNDSLSHKLYHGHVRLGNPSVYIWSDTTIPAAVKRDPQLARRIVHVHLPSKMDWVSSLARHGYPKVELLRIESEQLASACNVILSGVIYDHFRQPESFQAIARKLGFETLEHSTEALEGQESLKRLFELLCHAPDAAENILRRIGGRGWKMIDMNVQTDLADAWQELRDEGNEFKSRAIDSEDWGLLLGARVPVIFESRPLSNRRMVCRFVYRVTQKTYLVNQEIVKYGEVELATGPRQDSPGGLGDSIDGGSDLDRLARLFEPPLD